MTLTPAWNTTRVRTTPCESVPSHPTCRIVPKPCAWPLGGCGGAGCWRVAVAQLGVRLRICTGGGVGAAAAGSALRSVPAPALVGGGARSADEGPLTSDTDVELIARMAMRQMGKQYGSKQAELVEKLRDEMYDTASAFVELREDLLPGLAQQWGVPHRLLAAMHRLALEASSQASSGALAGPLPSPPQTLPLPAAPPPQGMSPTAGSSETASRANTVPPPPEALPRLPYQAGRVGEGRPQLQSQPQPQPQTQSRPTHGLARLHVMEDGWAGSDHVGEGEGEGEEYEEDEEIDEDDMRYEAVEEGHGSEVEEVSEGGGDEGGERRAAVTQRTAARRATSAAVSSSPSPSSPSSSPSNSSPSTSQDIRQISIMQRRCPSKFRFGHGSGREVRLTDRKRGEFYALKEPEMPAALAAELREFESFSLYGSFAGAQRGEPLRRVTLAGYMQCVRQALGWLHRVEGVPLEQLTMAQLVPGTQRGAARRVHAFLMWQEVERGMCKRSVARSLAALIQVAKFLHHEDSQVREGDKPYSDLEVIKTLRAMYMGYERAERVAGHVVDSSIKWLDWPAYLEYVGELRRECAALKHNGRPRSPVDVAMSLQAYLIAAILSCVPDRQRTLRELVVGRTLVKDKSGIWSIRHTHADYKTGGTYGERPPLVIDPGMYYELEEFIGTWRAHLKPQHNFLFSKRDGSGPLTAQELARSFSLNAFRITGRKLNPHMVRDMVVTYARSGHASEHELEALAIYMGHSLAEQRGTYDRRTKAQKVQPAMGLLAKISGAVPIAAAGPAAAPTGAPSRPSGPTTQLTTAQAAAGARAGLKGNNSDKTAVAGPSPAVAAAAAAAAVAKSRRKAKGDGSPSPPGRGATSTSVGMTAGEGAAADEDQGGVSSAAIAQRRGRGARDIAGESEAQEVEAGRSSRPTARRRRATAVAAGDSSTESAALTARAGEKITQGAGELEQSGIAARDCRDLAAGVGTQPAPELASKSTHRRRAVKEAADGELLVR